MGKENVRSVLTLKFVVREIVVTILGARIYGFLDLRYTKGIAGIVTEII